MPPDTTANPAPIDRPRGRRFRDVVSEPDGLSIRVYPMSFATFELHGEELAAVIGSLRSIDVAKLAAAGLGANAIWAALAPVAGGPVMRMVNDSCVPSLREVDAPVDVVIRCVVAWIDVSFLTGGVEKILDGAARLLSLLGAADHDGGGGGTTSAPPTTSPGSSASASTPPTSTAAGGSTVPPTPGGASASTATTSPPPAEPSAPSVPNGSTT